MRKAEFRNYYAREAARLRLLTASTTTAAVKARLTEQAEEHDRLAYGFEEDEGSGDRERRSPVTKNLIPRAPLAMARLSFLSPP